MIEVLRTKCRFPTFHRLVLWGGAQLKSKGKFGFSIPKNTHDVVCVTFLHFQSSLVIDDWWLRSIMIDDWRLFNHWFQSWLKIMIENEFQSSIINHDWNSDSIINHQSWLKFRFNHQSSIMIETQIQSSIINHDWKFLVNHQSSIINRLTFAPLWLLVCSKR